MSDGDGVRRPPGPAPESPIGNVPDAVGNGGNDELGSDPFLMDEPSTDNPRWKGANDGVEALWAIVIVCGGVDRAFM